MCHPAAVVDADAPGRLPRHDLPLLDGLRALAALMVLVTHVGFQTGTTATGALGAVVARLDLGVALFFALSGFLLVRPWLAAAAAGSAPPSVRGYLQRRAVRILPAYWVVLVVALCTTAAGAGLRAAAVNAALLQVYPPTLLAGLTQTWSLSTEVAFYLVLPLLAAPMARAAVTAAGRRRVVAWLATACGLAWLWTALAAAHVLPAWSGTWLPGHLDWFAVGLGLALAETRLRDRPHGRAAQVAAELAAHPGTLLVFAAALFWVACTPLGGPAALAATAPATAALKEAAYAVVAGALLVVAAAVDQTRGPVAALLGRREIQAFGRISYGVFLWHLLVLAGVFAVLDRAVFTGGFWPVLVLTLAGTIVVATVSWVLLEAPLLRIVHRRRSARVPTPPPPPARG